MRIAAAVLAASLAVASLALATPADAAGVTTHAWMSDEAIDQVTSPSLKALLVANRDYVRAGSHFPDSGYALSNTYGEEAHWQRFHDAYAAQILTHTECTDLTAPNGPCAQMVAFLMGMIGHGIGDEVWDWLYEPLVADHGEYYTPDSLGGYATEGGAETQLDLVAIGDFHAPTTELVAFPSHPDLVSAFRSVGRNDVDGAQFGVGQYAMGLIQQVERAWTPGHIDALHEAMPFTSHNMVTDPGGVEFAATAIAGAWDSMWGELLGSRPTTEASTTYPADGERRVPATGWARNHLPGSARGRGGARTRVAAVLTYSRPYVGSAGTTSDALPSGAMTLVERDTGTNIPTWSGYPRSVPYRAEPGERMIGFQPAGDLAPCTWYTASITPALVDARDLAVQPMSWDFRTGTDASGNRCADDPYTADENFARAVADDVLGRPATEAELQDLGDAFDRGRTRKQHTQTVLGSAELREKVVADGFSDYLGRSTDPGGLAYWADRLKTISIPEFHARLIGADELFVAAGGTNAGYVAALYPLVQGRPIDPAGGAYWTRRLDAGLARTTLARMLLFSHEAAQRTVNLAYLDLLGRTPEGSGLQYWTAVIQRGTDPRGLWTSIILTPEYDARAQQS